jgi:lipoprotein NlpD
MNSMAKTYGQIILVALLSVGCAIGPRTAPVVDRNVEANEPSAPAKSSLKTQSPEVMAKKAEPRPDIYRVKEGDTLYAIALDYGMDYRDLAAWNALSDPNRITVGQILTLRNSRGPVPEVPESEPMAVVAKPFVERELPAGEPLAESLPLKTEPKGEKLPYSDEALARLQEASRLAQPDKPLSKGEIHQEAASKPAALPSANTATVKGGLSGAVGQGMDAAFDATKWLWPAQGEVAYTFEVGRGRGIGIAGKRGDPVWASAAGKVVYVGGAIKSYGQLVIIKHSPDYLSVYAHNKQILVKEGDRVSAGQKIAEMGEREAGRATLHFEIRKLGQPMDPLKYLSSR